MKAIELFADVTDFIKNNRDEIRIIQERRDGYSKQIGLIKFRLYSSSNFRESFISDHHWYKWQQGALRELRDLETKCNELNDFLNRADEIRKKQIEERFSKLGMQDAVNMLKKIKKFIKTVTPNNKDDDDRNNMLLYLNWLLGTTGPLVNVVSIADLENIKQSYELQIKKLEQTRNQKIMLLESEIKNLQSKRGIAADVLQEIWDSKYEEIDSHRIARGIKYRVHLTKEDCAKIEAILGSAKF